MAGAEAVSRLLGYSPHPLAGVVSVDHDRVDGYDPCVPCVPSSILRCCLVFACLRACVACWSRFGGVRIRSSLPTLLLPLGLDVLAGFISVFVLLLFPCFIPFLLSRARFVFMFMFVFVRRLPSRSHRFLCIFAVSFVQFVFPRLTHPLAIPK